MLLSVSFGGDLIEYVYGADGARVTKTEKVGTGSETKGFIPLSGF